MIRDTCKFYSMGIMDSDCDIHNRIVSCCGCPDYEADPQITRDNDTMEIMKDPDTTQPDYEKLFKMQSIVVINQHEELNKLKYDNKIMIGLLKNNDRLIAVSGGSDGK